MLTADTITDDQIRELEREADAAGNDLLVGYCEVALSDRFPRARPYARAKCADAINAKRPSAGTQFERLVARVQADPQVKATISGPELEHVIRKTLHGVGLIVSNTGEVYDPQPAKVVTFSYNEPRGPRPRRRR